MNTVREAINSGRSGSSNTSALAFGGSTTVRVGSTESWNGTSWTSVADLATARSGIYGAGTQTSAVAAGGYTGTANSTATEEWNFGVYSYSAAAWASGGNMNTARRGIMGNGGGTQTAGIIAGGFTTANTAATELYNGTAWTSNPTGLNTARRKSGFAGSQTAGLIYGGTSTGFSTDTESWNGTSWTTVPANMNTAREALMGCGTQTAALAFGGYAPPGQDSAASESYNGTSWTSTPSLNTARNSLIGFGTQTAAIAAAGGSTNTESWNGTSWTALPATGPARDSSGSAGTQTAGITFGGTPVLTTAQIWNGTSWSNISSMSTGRSQLNGLGTQTAALASGGDSGSNTAVTEEWTGEVATATSKTLTTS